MTVRIARYLSAKLLSFLSYWLLLLGRVALVRGVAGYSHQTFPWTISRSVGRSVGLCIRASVCPMHCGKTADRIRMPFGIIGRTSPGMRQVVPFGDRSTSRATFGREFGTRHCDQRGIYSVRVRQCLNRRSCGLGGACGGPRHCCIRWGSTSCKGKRR